MNCTYLLSDVLDFLKDKEMIKGTLDGGKTMQDWESDVVMRIATEIQSNGELDDKTFGLITKMLNGELTDETLNEVSARTEEARPNCANFPN